MEEKYIIQMITGLELKDGKHVEELLCSNDKNEVIHIYVPVTESCDMLEGSIECQNCERQKTCEIFEPCNIDLGREIVIGKYGEMVVPKDT